MPKIQLKTNSPEYDARAAQQRDTTGKTRRCDMPGCTHAGEHRAPKDRSLADHYWFCLEHVQEYNAAWDFFAGMQAVDVERQIIASLYGDRPTWRSDTYRGLEAELQRKIHEMRDFTEEAPRARPDAPATGNPEIDALAVLDLTPPVTFEAIKKRYRELVKQYHPDHHGDDPVAQDLIKRVNMAYTILKMTYSSPSQN